MPTKLYPEVKIQADAIVDGVVYRTCPKCAQSKPLDAFGLRNCKNAGTDGQLLVRNQSWCRVCRSGNG